MVPHLPPGTSYGQSPAMTQRHLTASALHTSLVYYGKGENATFSTTTTSKIYPKNNSVQNRSVSELKKKKKKAFT